MIVIARKSSTKVNLPATMLAFLKAWHSEAVSLMESAPERETVVDLDSERRLPGFPAVKCVSNPRPRVQRPSLLGLFLPLGRAKASEFSKLPIIPSKVLNNPAAMILDGPDGPMAPVGKRWIDSCYVIPADSLGKSGEADRSQCNSIRLWIEQNVPAVDSADVAVLFLPGV